MAVRMHTAKKTEKKLRNKKPRYGIPTIAATIQSPPIQHLNFRLFKSDTSKKDTMH
jgi:hypothetical protein